MGCNMSRLTSGDETQMASGGLGPMQRKIEEIKKNRLRRKNTRKDDSIVSTTELISRQDGEVSEDIDSHRGSISEVPKAEVTGDNEVKRSVAIANEEETKKDNKNDVLNEHHCENGGDEETNDNNKKSHEDVEHETKLEEEEKGRRLEYTKDDYGNEHPPGSPSFRIFFMDDSKLELEKEDDDSLGSLSQDAHRSKDTVDLQRAKTKAARKDRVTRFRALARKPISYSLRSCYHKNSTSYDDNNPFSNIKISGNEAK